MRKKIRAPHWLVLGLLLLLGLLFAMAGMGPDPQPPQKQVRHTVPLAPKPVKVPPFWQEPQVASGIALIIDDAGYDMPALKRILALKLPAAISVIPDAPFAREAAELAHQAGLPVMLHLPMEPQSAKYRSRMTQAFLHEGLSDEQVRQTFLDDLALVPYVEGVNNHMGSYLTRIAEPMRVVMQVCREKELYFVDSKTSDDSVAASEAESAGVAWTSRDIFLDHQTDEAFLSRQWQRARACFAEGRRCLVIAHPHAETVAFLEKEFGGEDQAMMVTVRQLLSPASYEGEQGGILAAAP